MVMQSMDNVQGPIIPQTLSIKSYVRLCQYLSLGFDNVLHLGEMPPSGGA